MNTPRAINIGAILAAIMSFLQLLPQLLELIKPILDWLPKNGAMDTLPYALATFAGARGIQVGYRWLTSPRGARAALDDDLQAIAGVMARKAAEGTPESLDVVTDLGAIATKVGRSGAIQTAAERKEAKDAQAVLVDTIAEAVKQGMEKAKSEAEKPKT